MKKKSFIMLLCAVMVMTSVAFGTIAYLTDHDAVTNKFTVGNVDITVDETKVNPDGTPKYPEGTELKPDGTPVDPTVEPERTEDENTYPLIPGSKYVKDPTMTVTAGSKEAYVRMMVTISNAKELKAIFADLQIMYPEKYASGFLPQQHVTGWDNTVWQYIATAEDAVANTLTLEFRYPTTVEPTETEDMELPPLFKTIVVPGELSNDHLQQLTDFYIDVVGQAMQATGFENADKAWESFAKQTEAEAKLNPQP